MTLLRFAVQNHRSIRDRAELVLVSSALRTQRPADGDWRAVTHQVAGIFGANASGKSAVLDALHYAQTAVGYSSQWLKEPKVPRAPFRLDTDHPHAPSTYEFDLVIDGVRNEYGFSVGPSGVVAEWLNDYPNGRRRLLFERSGDTYTFGRGLARPAKISGATTSRELFLSRAASMGHEGVVAVHNAIISGIDIVRFGDHHRSHRLSAVIDALVDGSVTPEQINVLLQVADIGITTVQLREDQMPEQVRQAISRLEHAAKKEMDDLDNAGLYLLTEPDVRRSLEFYHRGQEGQEDQPLRINDESDGTIAWLSLAMPAVQALRDGTALAVDELDASLHPQLSAALIGMFTDQQINTRGAQLVFTTHDVQLLSPQSPTPLAAEEVWFTEKGLDGATSLFCLADFPHREADNMARRYSAGRYGAVPSVALSLVRSLLPEVHDCA
ncbi:MAG: ATP-binding protein [Micrococcales bacterium]|nr:ATP-binding protein [Micrococcales bacterium]MCL2667759.1 ATP-binding protein [Micrococcales bacterium]